MTNTAEELKAQAQKLLEQAAQQERNARKEKEEKEREERAKVLRVIHQNVADRLAKALLTEGTMAEVGTVDNWQGKNIPVVNLEADTYSRMIEITVEISRYEPNNILGVKVTVGTYGERPQSWTAKKAEDLNFQGIVRSIQRRIQKKKDAADVREAQAIAYKQATEIENHNRNVVAELQKLFTSKSGISLEPSRRDENQVVVRFGATLTVEQATKMVTLISNAMER